MSKLLASILAATLAISSSTAFAGGPVVDDVIEVPADKPATSVGILPLVIGAVILCAVVCGSDDEEQGN